jgi:glycosyltransferase involved in cell wall biosynthesis
MKKTKILFVHHASGWGGAPINMINIIKALDSKQFKPHVLLLKDSIVKERLEEYKIPYTVCNSYFYSKYYTYLSHSDAGFIKPYNVIKLLKIFISWFLSKYYFTPKILKKHTFDIVHLNSSVLSDWVYPSSKQGKVIYHIQEPISKGISGFRYNFIRSEVEKYADKVIAISKDNAERINLPQKTEVVYNFIEIPKNIEETNSGKSVLYVGGAAKIKGIEVLLDAIPLINKDIKLHLAGHFPNIQPFSKLKELAYKLRYPSAYRLRTKLMRVSNFKNVNIIGSIPSITNMLKESSLLISPFTKPHFSRPVIESFAYGKPVIVSDVVGMDEVVENNINGIIIDNHNPKALAEAINNLVNNYKLMNKMGINGRNKAIERYSPTPNILKIENIYKELVTDKAS